MMAIQAMLPDEASRVTSRRWREIRAIYQDVGTVTVAAGRALRRGGRAFCQGPCTLTGAFGNLCAKCPRGR